MTVFGRASSVKMTRERVLPELRTAWLLLLAYRWLTLGLAAFLALVQSDHPTVMRREYALLAAVAGYNLLLMLIYRRRYPQSSGRRLFIIDSVFSIGLLASSGGWHSPYYLYSMSTVLTTTLFVSFRAGLLAALIMAAGFTWALDFSGHALAHIRESIGLTHYFPGVFAYLLVAVFFGSPAGYVNQMSRRNEELRQAKESLGRANSDLESANRQLVTLQSVNAVIQSSLDLRQVLETVLEGIKYGLGFDRVILGLVDDGEKTLTDWQIAGGEAGKELEAWGSFRLSLARNPLISQAVHQRQAVKVTNGQGPAGISKKLLERLRSDGFAIVPMVVRDRAVGIILVENCYSNRPITDEDLNWLMVVVNQAAIAVNNAQLHQKAQELAAVHERHRLAMEIHDGLSQTLSGARLMLGSCSRLLVSDPDQVQKKLSYLDKMLARSYAEMRYAIFNLRLPLLAGDRLVALFRRYLQQFSEFTGIQSHLTLSGTERTAIGDESKQCLCRVLQEALANTQKHAAATSVSVFLGFKTDKISIRIVDNGQGFNVQPALARARQGKTFGLMTLRNRVQALGGSLSITSASGKGTTIKVTMPYSASGERYDSRARSR